jgi:hypothetical protein
VEVPVFPSAGSLSPLLFALGARTEGLGRGQVDIRVYGPLIALSGFGVRPGTEEFRRAWRTGKIASPPPSAELCPENARIVVHGLLQRIVTVDSDEDKALVLWRGVRLEPSSTICNGIRLTMRLIRLLRSAVT